MHNPPTTEDIILDRSIQGTDCQRCVDWAISMLMLGHETDYLGRLAGQLPPFDLDSIGILRDRALEELGFEDLSSEALICCSMANALQQHRNDDLMSERVLKSAKMLYFNHTILDLHPLYLLSHGLNDLEEFGDQWYAEGMNHSNASEIKRSMVDAFIKVHARLL